MSMLYESEDDANAPGSNRKKSSPESRRGDKGFGGGPQSVKSDGGSRKSFSNNNLGGPPRDIK